ncbi:MAG: hypothetical protein JKX79_08120 [Labilibaculum sp.]|nr:hypothetical protein [Labilibaculum sp.]
MMKKILSLLFFCTIFSGISLAQYGSYGAFRSFRIDAGGTYSSPSGEELKSGYGFYVNPKFHMNDNILLGVKYENIAFDSENDSGLNVPEIVSYMATIDYYMTTGNLRPFAGIDIGIYELGTMEVKIFESKDFELGSKFGIAPKIGLSFGHLDFTLQYNMIFDQNERFDDFNHTSVKLGFHLGGGKN